MENQYAAARREAEARMRVEEERRQLEGRLQAEALRQQMEELKQKEMEATKLKKEQERGTKGGDPQTQGETHQESRGGEAVSSASQGGE